MVENDPTMDVIALSVGEKSQYWWAEYFRKIVRHCGPTRTHTNFHLLRAQLGHFGTICRHFGPQFRKWVVCNNSNEVQQLNINSYSVNMKFEGFKFNILLTKPNIVIFHHWEPNYGQFVTTFAPLWSKISEMSNL